MTKAYDKEVLLVLIIILRQHSFDGKFGDMLMEYLSTISYSILINGSLCGFFPPSRGLRQGDSIFLTHFTLLADLLSGILAKSEAEG